MCIRVAAQARVPYEEALVSSGCCSLASFAARRVRAPPHASVWLRVPELGEQACLLST